MGEGGGGMKGRRCKGIGYKVQLVMVSLIKSCQMQLCAERSELKKNCWCNQRTKRKKSERYSVARVETGF